VYVLYPPLLNRVEKDVSGLKKYGVENIDLVLFRGFYKRRHFPQGYESDERKYILANVTNTNRRQKLIFESDVSSFGYKCASGREFFSMTENGDVKRCNTSKRVIFNMFQRNISFNAGDEPCPFLKCRCPYEGIDWAGTARGSVKDIISNMLKELPVYYSNKLTISKFANYVERRFGLNRG